MDNRRIIHDLKQSILNQVSPQIPLIDSGKTYGTARLLDGITFNEAIEDNIITIGANGAGGNPIP